MRSSGSARVQSGPKFFDGNVDYERAIADSCRNVNPKTRQESVERRIRSSTMCKARSQERRKPLGSEVVFVLHGPTNRNGGGQEPVLGHHEEVMLVTSEDKTLKTQQVARRR